MNGGGGGKKESFFSKSLVAIGGTGLLISDKGGCQVKAGILGGQEAHSSFGTHNAQNYPEGEF